MKRTAVVSKHAAVQDGAGLGHVLGKLVIGDRPREVAYEYSGVLESWKRSKKEVRKGGKKRFERKGKRKGKKGLWQEQHRKRRFPVGPTSTYR